MLRKRIGVIMYQTSKSKGQELVAQRMVRELNKLENKAYLITSIYHDGKKVVPTRELKKRGGYIYTEYNEIDIPIIRVDSYITRWPPRRIIFRDFIAILERIVYKFQLDVLITHSTLWNGPEEVAKFIDWRRDMKNLGGYKDPLVFCHMSHFQEPSPKRYSLTERAFRIAWNRLSLPEIFSTVNLLVVVTPFEKNAEVKLGVNAEKCFLFPGGVDDEAFRHYSHVDVQGFLKRLKKKEGTKIVTYLGSLDERKNPLAVLKVAERLQERSEIHFVLAGRGDSSYAKKVIKTVEDMPNITYLGEVSEQEKVLLTKVSHLNILLSQLEALGLAQIEFMYSGVPIITSAAGGQAWLVRDEVEGIHVNGPKDIEGAAGAITRLVDNPMLWNKLSANAKKRAANLTISKLTEKLDKAITNELIKERGLTKLPSEVQDTLAEPENVLKSWSSGNWGVIATKKRLFIKRGFISRKVTEIPYTNISSIEHKRNHPWKTLIVGSAISLILFLEPFVRPIFSRTFILRLEAFIRSLLPNTFLQSPYLEEFLDVMPILPFLTVLIIFAVQARTGFILQGNGIPKLYLPHKFREVITFIREIQNGRLLREKEEPSSTWKTVRSRT